MSDPITIKKYGNRRLYDTGESRYITLEELARKVQDGTDVRVVDAKSGEDLTRGTLTQIIVEGRGAARLLPVPLLTRLIRLGDDALAEFCSRYISAALDIYLQARRGADAMAAYNPFAAMPFATPDAFARMWGPAPFGASRAASPPPPPWHAESAPIVEPPPRAPTDGSAVQASRDEVAELRRELEDLRRTVEERTESDEPRQSAKPRPATRSRAKSRSNTKSRSATKPRTKDRTKAGTKSGKAAPKAGSAAQPKAKAKAKPGPKRKPPRKQD